MNETKVDQKMLLGGLERMLLCAMPEEMRNGIVEILTKETLSEEEAKTAYQTYAKRLVLLRPREEIHWNPSVDTNTCIGCGKCFVYCPHGVYEIKDKKAFVEHPTSCVILCSNCVTICPCDAISFPPQKDYVALMQYV